MQRQLNGLNWSKMLLNISIGTASRRLFRWVLAQIDVLFVPAIESWTFERVRDCVKPSYLRFYDDFVPIFLLLCSVVESV